MRTLGIISGEGFACEVFEDPDVRVHFTADADIDADGANGQNGGPPAYKVDNSGTEQSCPSINPHNLLNKK